MGALKCHFAVMWLDDGIQLQLHFPLIKEKLSVKHYGQI